MDKIKIVMPIADSKAVITSEIEPDYFSFLGNVEELLSTLVSAFYGYPVTVTARPTNSWSIVDDAE